MDYFAALSGFKPVVPVGPKTNTHSYNKGLHRGYNPLMVAASLGHVRVRQRRDRDLTRPWSDRLAGHRDFPHVTAVPRERVFVRCLVTKQAKNDRYRRFAQPR